MQKPPHLDPAARDNGVGEESLDPPAGVVALVFASKGRVRGRGRVAASDRVTVVYDCAPLLYQQVPEMSLQDAIRFGEACWQRVAESHAVRGHRAPRMGLAQDVDVEAGGDYAGDPLDVEE